MDTSCNMDTLDDSSTLPELSFDDLLEPSPVKKNGRPSAAHDDDDPLDFDTEVRSANRRDDSLNTPGSKRPQQYNTQSSRSSMPITNSSISTKPTPMRANPMKPGNSLGTSSSYGSMKTSGSSGGNPPILLNSKNVLPKTATQITNNSIRITQKSVSSGGNGVGGGGGGAGTSTVSLAGKTAVRTSTGQLIYIQKTPSASTSSSSAIKTSQGNTINVKPNATSKMTTAGGGGSTGGSKPVTIQVMRTADGSFVPVKSNAAGAANKNTTLTLSPTALAGKKIVTSSGGQMLFKTSMSSTGSTNTTATSIVKPGTSTTTSENMAVKPKTIVVQSSSGKQIIVSNPNMVKLSPKTQTTSGSNTSTTSSVTSGQGQLHTLQIPGKTGVQYVRVMPSTKVNAKPVATTSSSDITTSSASKTVTTSSSAATTVTNTSSVGAPVKILNNLPQKFTVLQKGTATKVVVTHKKDSNTGDFSPVASKVQRTIVTVPTIRSLNDDKPKSQTSQQSLIKPLAANQSLIRKHKISEINTEIKRITAAESAEDNGPPEIKKPTPNSRLVVISSNTASKILNNSLQQPGRATTAATSGAIQVQGTKVQATSSNTSSSSATTTTTTKPLYTILKQSTGLQQQQQQQQQHQNQTKVYSVLKSNSYSETSSRTSTQSASALASTSTGQHRSLINKQSLMQQQQKIFQLKQLQKPQQLSQSYSTPTSSSSSSSTFLSIKIKEEPIDFLSESATTSANYSASSFAAPQPPPPPPPPPAAPAANEDPNKMDLVGGVVRRKHCNCSKSQCLKLYCDCFANGEFCQDCTCKDCFNNLENEDERQKAIKSCLERNPSAFKPKITSSSDQGDMRLHNKGCNCKRSGCLKNYCECYEAKIPCSSNCKCVGCRNIEDRADLDLDPIDPKIMATLANASSQMQSSSTSHKRTYEKFQRDSLGANVAIKTEKYSKEGIKTEPGATATPPVDKQQQCNFITQEVVDATIQCMITQADECEKNRLPAYQTEKMVMEELGRCLVEIIDFSIRNTDTSYSQD